jgi:hypothetical protein
MSHRTLAAFLVVSIFSVSVPRAGAQPCAPNTIPYQVDVRDDPFETPVSFDEWTAADALIILSMHLTPEPDGTTYRMRVFPWDYIKYGSYVPGCPDRDYHLQPASVGHGSGVLVGSGASDSSDRIFTAGHVLRNLQQPYPYPPFCGPSQGLAVVFGYGNFSPNQWVPTCDPFDPGNCWVIVNKSDVYFCVEQWDEFLQGKDWGVGRLDRKVRGRTPLRIHTDVTAPNTSLMIIGHPNAIPMKLEQVQLQSWGNDSFSSTGHILSHSSGSMVLDTITGEVIGTVTSGNPPIGLGCYSDPDVICYRENFALSGSVSGTAAYLAAPYIP